MKTALIKLHVAVFLWGFTGVLGRLISLSELPLVWYRILITVLSLWVVLLFTKKLVIPTKKQLFQLFGIGGIIAIHWVCFYGSIKYANVSTALTCLSSAGLFTALLEPIFQKKKIHLLELILGIFGIVGLLFIFHFNPSFQKGLIIGIIGTFLSVVFTVFNKHLIVDMSSKTMLFYELIGGLFVLTFILPFYVQLFPTINLIPSIEDIGWLILMSWFCTLIAFDLSLQALKQVSAFTQNLILNLEPLYGILLAFAVYQENKYLSTGFYIGFSLIMLTVVIQMISLTKNDKGISIS